MTTGIGDKPDKAEAMDLEIILGAIKGVVQSAMIIPLDDAQRLAAEIQREDAIGPIFNPTWWIQNSRNISDNNEIVQAYVQFRARLERLRVDVEARAAARSKPKET